MRPLRFQIFSFWFFIFAFLVARLAFAAQSDDLSTAVLAPSGFAQGFREGTVISYTILHGVREPIFGRTEVRNGELSEGLPQFDVRDSSDDSYIAYEMRIDEPGQNFKQILLTYDPVTESLDFKGTGFSAFEKFLPAPDSLDIYADWAGQLVIEDLNFEMSEEGIPYLKFAFAGFDMPGHSENTSLRVIQIGAGGGPTKAGVNAFQRSPNSYLKPKGCKPYALSNCDQSALDRHLDQFVANVVEPMAKMTEELSAVMMQQMQILGGFMDADMAFDTQREHQALKAEAMKDYHPGDQMCRFGTFARGLGHASFKARYSAQAMNQALIARSSGTFGLAAADGAQADFDATIQSFEKYYCDLADNNRGMEAQCGEGPKELEDVNKDIDFVRTVGYPLTLNVDFRDGEIGEGQPDERHVQALAKNLYASRTYSSFGSTTRTKAPRYGYAQQDARNLVAAQAIAHNTFAQIVGLKSRGGSELGEKSGGAHMKAMFREMGIADEEIESLLGEDPSYYAQMEVLAKAVYQNPHFYTNLYDKPTNVERVMASMEAIRLMQMRDYYQSMQRREILLSQILNNSLDKYVEQVNVRMQEALGSVK